MQTLKQQKTINNTFEPTKHTKSISHIQQSMMRNLIITECMTEIYNQLQFYIDMQKPNIKNKCKQNKAVITAQEKQPCLRALQKKLRNLNKKLTEIIDLEKKHDLKPEQLQKVNKKNTVLREKQKYEDYITIYKQILAENVEGVRNYQLGVLKDIAMVLAAREYGEDSKSMNNVDSEIRKLYSPSSLDITLEDRVNEITQGFIILGDNNEIKQIASKFIEQNKHKILDPGNVSNVPQISEGSYEERKQAIDIINDQLHQPVLDSQVPIVIVEPIFTKVEDGSTHQLEPTEEHFQDLVAQSRSSKEEINCEQPKADTGPNREQLKSGKREKTGQQENRRARRARRKKVNPKSIHKENQSDDSSSSKSVDKPKEFKPEQKKKLEDQGFNFVKDKPKARDQQAWHAHQHGRKTHHHQHSRKAGKTDSHQTH